MTDLVYIWYDERYSFKVFFSSTPTHMHDLQVKVMERTFMLKFCVKDFKSSLFPNHYLDLFYIWYGNRYMSKVFLSSPPPLLCPSGQGHGLRTFVLKFYFTVFQELIISKSYDRFEL